MRISHNPTKMRENLNKIFGYDHFMSDEQEAATKEVFTGVNDVYINLPPGAGKSICFQLPAVLKNYKLAVVFVPTNSLGQAQVDFLRQKNINAEYLYRGIRKNVRKAVLNDLRSHETELRFLYASVDKATRDTVNELIIELRAKNTLSFIVLDEAHCISRLSHDYMSDYREVAKLIKIAFPNIRKVALTGTATPEVREDLIHELGMTKVRQFLPTLHQAPYHDVHFLDTISEPLEHVKVFIEEHLGPLNKLNSKNLPKGGIIFCRKKEAARNISRRLRTLGVSVVAYHGDLSWKDRKFVRESWITGSIPVIVTTPKFGIGLHRPNLSFVVHWSMPMSIQQLYQEMGRISQNEEKISYRLYFSTEEENDIMMRIKSLPNVPSYGNDFVSRQHRFFEEVIEYCLQTKCRHVTLIAYFGQKVPNCRLHCDACRDYKGLRKRIEQFVSYQSFVKKKMDHNLAFKTIRPPGPSACSRKLSKKMTRSRQCQRLFEELTNNYTKAEAEIGNIVTVKDLPEIARQLEYSVYTAACSYEKYKHDVLEAVRGIRKSSNIKVPCGYLKFFQAEKKSFFQNEPEVIDVIDDVEPMEVDIVEAESSSVLIDLIDDTDSGSETA